MSNVEVSRHTANKSAGGYMLLELLQKLGAAFDWSNANSGVVSIGIFLATMAFGWISGIFSALRRKPRLKLRLIDGPTFCCNFPTGHKFNGHDVHRTGFAIYLEVTNVGSAASSISDVSIAYHWNITPFSIKWLRYRFGWHWETQQTVALQDFQVAIGDSTKVYPFLFQYNNSSPTKATTFLQVGQSTNGVIYFEQGDSWGACSPAVKAKLVLLKVKVRDVFGKAHCSKFKIPAVSMEYARKYNPSFGKTIAVLKGIPLPSDALPIENGHSK